MDLVEFFENKVVIETLNLLSGKWKFQILRFLCENEGKRFSQIQQQLESITPKMLSAELKILEDNRLVTRKAFPTVPVTVEYKITEHGKTLKDIYGMILEWGRKHSENIKNGPPQG